MVSEKQIKAAVDAVSDDISWVAALIGGKYDSAEEVMREALTAAEQAEPTEAAMSDKVPERIWVWPPLIDEMGSAVNTIQQPEHVEYVRADKLEELAAQLLALRKWRQEYVGKLTIAEAALAEARKALGMMLKEHDILSGNFGDVMDPKHKRPDRWPTAAEAARRALEGGQEDGNG